MNLSRRNFLKAAALAILAPAAIDKLLQQPVQKITLKGHQSLLFNIDSTTYEAWKGASFNSGPLRMEDLIRAAELCKKNHGMPDTLLMHPREYRKLKRRWTWT